jgi:branched-subunit amino acid transport protein AzlD
MKILVVYCLESDQVVVLVSEIFEYITRIWLILIKKLSKTTKNSYFQRFLAYFQLVPSAAKFSLKMSNFYSP